MDNLEYILQELTRMLQAGYLTQQEFEAYMLLLTNQTENQLTTPA